MAARRSPSASRGSAAGPEIARFLLRLPARLHRELADRARRLGLSLNEYCVRRLSSPEAPVVRVPQFSAVVDHARQVAGDTLIGLILHGSWTRGEARATSDIDVLVVLDRAVPLSRALYRQWDATPVVLDGRAVDIHFLHLPPDAARAGAVWCEAAVEGRILLDRDGRVEDTLLAIRREIADGRLVRKQSHGQPYWTVVAA